MILLVQLYDLAPSGLFYFVLIGWLLYLAIAIGTGVGRELAHPSAMALSILTLLASIPQPEHYSLVSSGDVVAALLSLQGQPSKLE